MSTSSTWCEPLDLVAGTRRFEESFASLVGVPFAVAFGYSRSAMAATVRALGSGRGDEVVLSALTCKVVCLAFLAEGLQPVYADIARDSLNLDPVAVARACTPRTRAVLFQRTYGSGTDAAAVADATGGTPLLEDCAQCVPAPHPGRPLAAYYSNNLSKPLPAGSGGVVTTSDSGLAAELRKTQASYPVPSFGDDLRLGIERWVHTHLLRPSTYTLAFEVNRLVSPLHNPGDLATELEVEVRRARTRPSTAQMAAGLAWLRHAEAVARHRRHCAQTYARLLAGSGIETPGRFALDEAPYYFPVLVDRKRELLRLARRRNVPMVAWPLETPIYPVRARAALARYGYAAGSAPVAEAVAQRLVGLPTDVHMRDHHLARVVSVLAEHLETSGR